MKIGIISLIGGLPWGGSEELWSDLAHYAVTEGHSVVVSYPYWENKPEKIIALEKEGVKFYFRSQKNFLSRATNYFRYRLKATAVFPGLPDEKPDVLLINSGTAFTTANNLYYHRFLLQLSQPFFLLLHHNVEEYSMRDYLQQRARETFPKAKKIFFVSHRNWKNAERQIAMRIENAEVVTNPLVLVEKNEIAFPPLMNNCFQFASVGRLSCIPKGQDLLIDALSSDKWKARNWQLNFYGEGTDEMYLRQLVKLFGLEEKVFFRGHVPVKKIWEYNHLLIMPSLSEGTSLALLEAMCCGRPAVTTDVGGQTEWLSDNLNGFVAAAPTVRLIDEALDRAWNLRDQWKQMGLNGHNEIVSRCKQPAGKEFLQRLIQLHQS